MARRGFKGSVYEGGIRMPAIVRWPGHVKAGSITGELAATYDIFTTMLTMAAVPLPSDRSECRNGRLGPLTVAATLTRQFMRTVIDGKDLSPIIFVRSAFPRAVSTSSAVL